MTGSYFLLPMAMGAVLGWASYNVVAHVTSKRQINTLRAISWGVLATLTLMLGVSAFSAIGAEQTVNKQNVRCSNNSPECYAKAHYNPVRKCKQAIDEKAEFRHIWLENASQQIFEKYLWHDQTKRTIQIFGQQAKAINSLGILTPLQYFCIFNANTGEITAAAFE
ncbi:Uncharacterised protein [Campylobacter jejuni]|nr:Uncharacterised protein [Campylobacter jejuni]